MVQYYTLEQAAQILRTTPDKLKEMAKKNEVRAFQDRGSLRFRAQEIDELARMRGLGSDPELPLGEAPPAKPGGSSGGGRHTTHAPADVFNFSLGEDTSDEVALGAELLPGGSKSGSKGGSGARKSPTPSRSGPRSPAPGPKSPPPGPKSPPPRAGSDSDVRLVMDGSELDFQIATDSDVQVARDPASKEPKSGSGSGSKKKSQVAPPGDSGVRIVPLDAPSDSDVKIVPHSPHDSDVPLGESKPKTASDSDIRVEELKLPPAGAPSGRHRGAADPNITEEIDLDAEARKAEEAAKKTGKKGRTRAKQPPALPTSSPFELSESEVDVDQPAAAHTDPATADTEDSSSDFELKPVDSLSPLEIDSDEVPKLAQDDEVELGAVAGGGRGGSGINLQDPADSGLSLEQGGSDEIEFELSLDAAATPKPAADKPDSDSSSEFELSLDDDAAASSPTGEDSDSEFELSLDVEGSDAALEKVAPDSDSEFELTLDESGSLAPAEEGAVADDSDEKDIFETDFEVPALDEESGSEAVALDESDTDLESSDFDLALDQEGGEESGSEVVALEGEEEADEGAATVARPRRAAGAAVAEGEEEALEQDFEEDLGEAPEEEPEPEPAVAAAPAPPAEWGALPAVLLIPGVIVLFLAGVMSFELLGGMWGYHRGTKTSNLVTKGIAGMFTSDTQTGD